MQQLKNHPFFQSQRNLQTRNLFSRQNIMQMCKRSRSVFDRKQPNYRSIPRISVQKLQSKPCSVQPRQSHPSYKSQSHILPATGASINNSSSVLSKTSQQQRKSLFIARGFKPHLGKKCLQDNPLLLGSILKKKLKVMEKVEVDRYLRSIIQSKVNEE